MRLKKTTRLASLDKKHVWHPFTQMREWDPSDFLVIEKARGSYLYDTDGKKYLDGVSSLWCNVHGHRVPAIDAAVKRQLSKVAHSTFLGLSNVPAVELAARLSKMAPRGLEKVFYSDSGSEAVEIAIKMAYQYWKYATGKERKVFVRLENAYHGDTLGSVSVGGIGLFHKLFKPLLFKTAAAPADAKGLEAVVRRHRGQVAAIVVEPLVQGAAGMRTHPEGFLKAAERIARKHDTLLIVDEVATGFGRTGKMFACEHEGVRPDLMCVAKGLTGGYLPLAATLATNRVYDAFLGSHDEFKTFFHGHTYTANPLACAAALASLELFAKNKTLAHVHKLAATLAALLAPLKKHPHVAQIRQVGLMAGIELVEHKKTGKPYAAGLTIGAKVCRAARDKGVIVRPLGNVIVLMPPFSFTEVELVRLWSAIARSIDEICSAQHPLSKKICR